MARPLWKSSGYQLTKFVFWIIARVVFRFRWQGKEYFPTAGGALICSNHQSFFDPVLIGICFRKQLNYLARQSLFRSTVFGGICRYLDAIPIDRDGMGLSGVKETLRRLKRGEIVVVFPEGTRTLDGRVGDFKPGICALVRRGKVPILPAAVDGAFDAWPRTRRFPRLTAMRTCFGPMLTCEQIDSLTDAELIAELRRRIIACHLQARRFRGVMDDPYTSDDQA
jgi:1-acyl-sn-glycerol-3-phosphate acyltransferase